MLLKFRKQLFFKAVILDLASSISTIYQRFFFKFYGSKTNESALEN